MSRRAAMLALVVGLADEPVFREAVSTLESMLLGSAASSFERPVHKGGVSEWLGQVAADRLDENTMLIPADVVSISEHIAKAIALEHPLARAALNLPADVRLAAEWICDNRGEVGECRKERIKTLRRVPKMLAPLDARLWSAAPPHVQAMVAYKPRGAFIHAVATAIRWPDATIAADMLAGMLPVGELADTGVFRQKEAPASCDFEASLDDAAAWNRKLFSSIEVEGRAPRNRDDVAASWARTQEEVEVGWATPVAGGLRELDARFGGRCRVMRRFAVMQNGKCRNCDNGATSGHNDGTSTHETISPVRADFVIDAAAAFADILDMDGSWTMELATCDAVAAYRRLACADESATVVAQWDPTNERVAVFYVQGFNLCAAHLNPSCVRGAPPSLARAARGGVGISRVRVCACAR
jgi:hypothetical protein